MSGSTTAPRLSAGTPPPSLPRGPGCAWARGRPIRARGAVAVAFVGLFLLAGGVAAIHPTDRTARNGTSFAGPSLWGSALGPVVPGNNSSGNQSGGGCGHNASMSLTPYVAPPSGFVPLSVEFSVSISCPEPNLTVTWNTGYANVTLPGPNVSYLYTVIGHYAPTVSFSWSVNGSSGSASYGYNVVVEALPGLGNWTDLTPTAGTPPSPRGGPAMAFDPALNGSIVFGGYTPGVGPGGNGIMDNDTWLVRNGTWTNLSAGLPIAPAARSSAAFAWDPVDQYLVLFGGRNATAYVHGNATTSAFLNDTWVFNRSGWTKLPISGPSPRNTMQITWDAHDGYLLLFGGGTGNINGSNWTIDDDTWSFVHGAWTNRTPTLSGPWPSPPPTSQGEMDYDPAFGAVILIGGFSGGAQGSCTSTDPQTWAYSAGTWTNFGSPYNTSNPPVTSDGILAFDVALGYNVLYGGIVSGPNGACTATNSTWVLLNANHTAPVSWGNLSGALPVNPGDVEWGAGTYDNVTNQVLLFGGDQWNSGSYFDSLWAYNSPWGSGSSSGGGGPGGNGSHGGGPSGHPPPPNSGGPSQPLSVRSHAAASTPTSPYTIEFIATVTGGIPPYRYAWNFGDGTPGATTATASHTYAAAGTYWPTLSVQDASGARVTALLEALVVPAGTSVSSPPPAIALPPPPPSELLGIALAALVGGTGGAVLVAQARRRWSRLREEGEELLTVPAHTLVPARP